MSKDGENNYLVIDVDLPPSQGENRSNLPFYTEGFCTKCGAVYYYIDTKCRGLNLVCTTCQTEQKVIWRPLVVLDTPGKCPDCQRTVFPEEFNDEVTFFISPQTGKIERHLCGLKVGPVIYKRPD